MAGVLADAERRLALPSYKKRQEIWADKLAGEIIDKDFLDANAPALASLVGSTLSLYTDLASQRLVRAFVAAACKRSEPFVRALAAVVVKAAAAKPPPSRAEAQVLLHWTAEVLLQLDPEGGAKKAVSKLAEVMVGLLDQLSAALPAARWGPVGHLVRSLTRRKPAMEAELLAAAKAAANGSGAVRALLDETAPAAAAPAPALYEQLLSLYLEKGLAGARERMGPEVAAAYRPLFARLGEADLGAKLLPAVSKALRRVPDVAMGAVVGLAAAAPAGLDMSRAAGELVPLLVQQMRLKESVRAAALEAVRALAGRCGDAAVLEQLVTGLRKILDGSAEGKIKVAAERSALAAALGALAEAPVAGEAMSPLAEGVAAFLATAVKEELSEDVKVSLLGTLAAWLPRLAPAAAAAPPAAVPAQLLACLRDGAREGLRRAAARAALAAVRSRPELAGPLLAQSGAPETCLKWVSDALAKPALRLDGVLGALVVARALEAAGASESAAAVVPAGDKAWAGALRADSPLLQPANAAKLPPADCPRVGELAEVLLGQERGALRAAVDATEGCLDALCRLLVCAALHFNRETRAAAQAACRRLAAAQASRLMVPLTSALRYWMNNRASLPVAVDPTATGDDATPTAGSLAMRFGEVLRALAPARSSEAEAGAGAAAANGAPTPLPLDGAAVAGLLLAGHHPALDAPMRRAPHPWTQVHRRLGACFDSRVHYCAATVCELLAGPDGLASPNPEDREAACGAMGAAMQCAPTAMYSHVMAVLGSLLVRSEHDSLTEADKEVYETPEGILSSERVPAGVYVPEVVVNKNVKKPRGRFKTDNRAFADDDDDDDTPAPPPARAAPPPPPSRASAAASTGPKPGPGKKDAAARQEEFRRNKLAAESELRARIRALRSRLELGLRAMGCVVEAAPRDASQHLEEYQELCLPLMSSWLVGEAAFDAVRALSTCMPGRLGASATTLTACLRLVSQAQSGRGLLSYREVAYRPAVASVVHALAAVTAASGQQLPPSSYSYVFPVLQAVLLSPVHTALHDECLAVVALHVAPGLDIPRRASLELLYHLLGVIPAYRDRIVPLLRSLCAGCLEDDLPAATSGLTHPAPHVRAAALAALPCLPLLAEPGLLPPGDDATAALLWLARSDVGSEDNAAAAAALWEAAGVQLGTGALFRLTEMLASEAADVQYSAAAGLAAGLEVHPEAVSDVLAAVVALYDPAAPLIGRVGVAVALRSIAPRLGDSDVNPALDFLIGRGLADEEEKVREEMVAAGMSILDSHGALHAPRLLPLFESHLDRKGRGGGGGGGGADEEEARFDLVREGVVVLLGTIARHLPPSDPKRAAALDLLMGVLGTPSESVQRSVSNCLPPLVAPLASNTEYTQGLVDRLLTQLTKGATYGERRGAAFGLSGLVKGLGIMAMKNFNIMDSLKAAVEDKKDPVVREGGLLAFECLSDKLGKLFEPYVIHVLPMLLNCFGDPSPQVRQATEDAARMIMGQLTASGVKLVLPALLKGLEDKVWRTKQGSVQLLGAMAHCAPKQLGTCLPTIVPKLGEVLSDPHPKVQAAAQEALNEIGSVIRNPEVQRLVPSLLSAIADPNAATRSCLDILLDTVFINTIDAPSLALIVPVVHRGLRDRSGDTKKRAARTVGSMCSLVNDAKDMGPYVPLLMPELQKSLVDPLPEVRAVSARAIGSLMKGMGQDTFGHLVPWLLETLASESSSVERSGAAQGLAEVLAVLGPDHLDALLPDVLASAGARSRPAQREGALTLFQFLPLTMEAALQTHLPRVLPAILDGLSDEAEGVRDAALGAGRILVDHYARTALPLLLPAVEEGVFAENWRIRQSSVKLLGKLLFKIAGASGNVVLDGHEDEEGVAEESYGEAIIAALGMDRRNEVLARLYIVRTDVQYTVRQEALHVWKTVVVNTPKTLGQILQHLMQLVIESLADEGEDRRQAAARCLGELVRKMGERVLARIIPILREGIGADSAATRQGVCLGLKEVLDNLGRHQLQEHLAEVLPTVQSALTDTDPAVREAAGAAFGILFKGSGAGGGGGGGSAVDGVVPSMLAGLEHDRRYRESLEGLRVILQVRPQIFHFVCPKLLHRPLALNAVRALGELAPAADTHLNNHLDAIMPALLAAASGSRPVVAADGHDQGEVAAAGRAAAAAAAVAVALAVDEEGLHLLVPQLVKGLDEAATRMGACALISAFAAQSKHDFQEHVPQLVQSLVLLLAEDCPAEELLTTWKALEAVCGAIPKEALPEYVNCLKVAIADAREKERRKRRGGPLLLAGLCVPPKALAPLLPIYLQGVLQGSSAEVREAAAEGLGELVGSTSEEALKPFVVSITGPLIRIIGDRFPSPIKAAILGTLGLLIAKAGPGLKPFVPQLQTTFLKCLNDQSDVVRTRAADNLGELTRMSARLEQLVQDLATSGRTAEPQIRDAHLRALRGALLAAGERLAAPAVSAVADTLRDTMRAAAGDDDEYRVYVGSCLGALCRVAPPDVLRALLAAGPLAPAQPPAAPGRQLNGIILATAARHAGAARLEEAGLLKPFQDAIRAAARDEDTGVKTAAARAAARLAASAVGGGGGVLAASVAVLQALLGPDQGSEVVRVALLAVRGLAMAVGRAGGADVAAAGAEVPDLLEPHLPALVPSMCAVLAGGSASGITRSTAEAALQKLLRVEAGLEVAQRYLAAGPAAVARQTLTDSFLRRLQKLTDEDLFAAEEY
ncbi:hypothetical protein PLESTB_001196200 [Pleodorina starrii]|uniref:TOG domain-containing protein n=1 Tax=Pleodorina starrii TaxID=330485 RepID=A0A9W6BSC2_9CHLO|nr:hypothetical protein PLESTM_001833700 [Pleodorina starrii]GLC57183.1 hypothetical protein PLESTB_001196200 [Pleodorina starrii]GLC71436.1 hypothetical protein PLESTF_001115700 [Pleodorina starrii]